MPYPQLIFPDEVCERAERVMDAHPELRRVSSSVQDQAFVRDRGTSSAAYFALACERYAGRDAFVSSSGTLTYGRLWERVTALVDSCTRERMFAHGSRVGLCGGPSPDYVIADLACLAAGALSVPLATTLTADEIRAQIEHAGVSTVLCAASHLASLARALEGTRLVDTVIVIAPETAETAAEPGAGHGSQLAAQLVIEALRRARRVVTIGELEDAAAPVALRRPVAEVGPDVPVTVMYTSGSTGRAKGVVLTERRWRAQLDTALSWPALPHVQIAYLPHSAITGRRSVVETMMNGGLTYFSTGVPPLEDVPRGGPTLMPLVPRMSSALYQQFQSLVVSRYGLMPSTSDPRVADAMREFGARALGDRLFLIRVGAGTTSPSIIDFLTRCFGVMVANGYGQTETGSIALNGRVFGHVEYKLVDVPELGYSSRARPPRGELLVRSAEVTPGYLDNPQATAALFDEEGFLRTGDIMEEVEPGQLTWIDRRATIVKLAQGLFVATTHLESLYVGGSAFIRQIYLYANPLHDFLLAVIVPNPELIAGHTGDGEATLRRLLRAELDRVARAAGLRAHEIPRDFILEHSPFTEANHLVLESGKPNLPRLRERYAPRLDALYAEIAARQSADVDASAGADLPGGVKATLAAVLGLGVAELDAAPDVSFTGFGGDSITALRFCSLVERAFGIAVPVASVLDPTAGVATTVSRVVQLVERGRDTASFEDIHGAGATTVQADHIARLASSIEASQTPIPRTGGATLLTGATGFLGALLAVELARREPLICVVRGEDERAATERLRRVFQAASGDLTRWFDDSVASGQLAVVAGDLQRPLLGLSSRACDDLVARIDAIVHNGALVNHAMSYRDLFEPNVIGTVEVARLAARRPGVALHFVSTVAVASRPGSTGTVAESERASSLGHSRPIGGGPSDHAVGYATSKWASELVPEQFPARPGVAINVFRCGNIAPHRDYPAHLNWPDNTNRLLYGIAATGLVPDSFYTPGSATPHHDILPLDTVAASIAAIAGAGATGYSTYHVSSAGGPAVSLDTLASWVESAGVKVRRLPHAAWFAAFRDALEALPPDRRARTPHAAIARWSTPLGRDHGERVSTTEFRRATRAALDREVLPLDERRTHAWLRALTSE